MKIPKVLTMCLVLCCLCSNVFGLEAIDVGIPCINITKEASCPYATVGQDVIYTIIIENCGEVDLELVGLTDTLLPVDIGPCQFLPMGGVCAFEVPYTVQDSDLDPLVNQVTVTAVRVFDGLENAAIIVPEEVSATAEATVDLLHPDFDIYAECLGFPDGPNSPDSVEALNGGFGMVPFSVCVSNTGDVELDIELLCLGTSISIQPGDVYCQIVEVPLEGIGPCGTGGFAQLTCEAIGRIPGACEVPELTRAADAFCALPPCQPSFTVENTCLTSPAGGDCALRPGDPALYEIIITNTSICEDPYPPLDLNFIIDDDLSEEITNISIGPIPPGGALVLPVEVLVPDCPPAVSGCIPLVNTVTVQGFCAYNGELLEIQTAEAACEYTCNPPEGCTPGFWKNHPACWCDAYAPEMLISDAFTRLADPPYDTLGDDEARPKSDFDNDTLMDALRYRGGPDLAGSVRNMLRHATAAVLNSCSTEVYYAVSEADIIDVVNLALDSQDISLVQYVHSVLAAYNEDFPCPIDAHCERMEDVNGD